MRKIEILSKQIKEEIKDARKYIECALKNKQDEKDLAEVYYMLAGEEMGHADRLHAAVVKEIAKFKGTGEAVPVAMQTIWDWEHKNIIEDSTEVKLMIELYRK